MLDRLGTIYQQAMKILVAVLAAVTLGVTTWGVFSRNLLGQSVVWADTAATWLFVWIVLLGSSIAITRGSHMEIGLAKETLPPKLMKMVVLVGHGAVTVAALYLGYAGYKFLQVGGDTVAPALGATMSWVLWAFPVGCVLMAGCAIERLIRALVTPAADLRKQIKGEAKDSALEEEAV